MDEKINGRTPEEIKKRLSCCSKEGGCYVCPDVAAGDCSLKLCADALAYIEHLEAQRPKWISVEERLPEESGKYIVCTRKKAVYCTAFRFFHGKGYFATDKTTHITHWMPMPEPPEVSE